MLPVDLFGPLSGLSGDGLVDGDPGDLAATQVAHHVVHSLKLLL